MLPDTIIITESISSSIKNLFTGKSYSKIGVLVDENTHNHCYPLVKDFLPDHNVFVIKSGEEYKTLKTCSDIWNFLTESSFDRKALLINLGGGVIGDMGGFCAATYKRGIQFINIPTTLLSQVDASIGGKLGIDFEGLKNHIGLFKDPEAIIIYPDFLKSLDKRQIRSGFAEIIKHCLIADSGMWSKLTSTNINQETWEEFILHSTKIKYQVITEDPQEKGLRKILNFGHTIGHAVESHYLNDREPLLHGEAIAIGMICEAYLSKEIAGLGIEELKEIEEFILKVYGPKVIPETAIDQISEATLQDKKNENANINCTLLSSMGKAEIDQKITPKQVIEALNYYNRRVN